jgi:hypothetical protein
MCLSRSGAIILRESRMSTKILGNSAASSYWTGFPEDVQSLDRFTRMAPLPATPSKRGLGGPSSKERFGSATERPSSSFRLTLRLVEGFASHPPQRTRKDGAPSWLAETRLPAPVGCLVSFREVGSAVPSVRSECWRYFLAPFPPVPRSRRERLTADKLETIIVFFPLGSRLFVSAR